MISAKICGRPYEGCARRSRRPSIALIAVYFHDAVTRPRSRNVKCLRANLLNEGLLDNSPVSAGPEWAC